MSEPKTLGRYVLVRQLGTGGLASVHLARIEGAAGFERHVAIKVLHPNLRSSRALTDLFIQEARTTSGLTHPNIAQVYELEELGGQLFMVMEYLEGLDLRQLLDRLAARGETMATEHAMAIVIEVTKALGHAHAVYPTRRHTHPPVIHRDLSPGNVMVTVDGVVKLLDFGVAKTLVGDATADQVARGKWPYMSPEQVRGEPLDPRSDLFSLGSLLYELLTGRQAFAGRTQVDSMRRVERADVPPASGVDPVVEAVLSRLLSRQREDRYGDAGEALSAMSQVMLLRGCGPMERALADLLGRLAEPSAIEDDEETGLMQAAPIMPPPGRGVPKRAMPASLCSTPLPAPKSSLVPSTSPEGGLFDSELATLPPARQAAPPPDRAAHPQEPPDPMEEDTTVTTGAADAEGRCQRAPEHARADLDTRAPSTKAEESIATQEAEISIPALPLDEGLPHAAWLPERTSQPTPSPHGWPRRNLLVLALAVLTVLVAGLAILLAVKQRRGAMDGQEAPKAASGAPPAREEAQGRPGAGTDQTAADRPLAPGNQSADAGKAQAGAPGGGAGRTAAADAGPDRTAAADAGRGRTAAPDTGPDRTAAPDAGRSAASGLGEAERVPPGSSGAQPLRPHASDAPPKGRPPVGAPGRGELDILTRPTGAAVLVEGEHKGKTPLRIDVTPGKKIHVLLHLGGRGLYRTPLWMPPLAGRRLDVILPFVSKQVHPAKPGRTAIRVLCEASGPTRVFLDGLDTGVDCPTPPLAVLPVAHSVSVYMGRLQRTLWKQVRPKAGLVTDVQFTR